MALTRPFPRSSVVLAVRALVVCLALSLLLPRSSAGSPQWVSVTYSSCSQQHWGEAFATLKKDATSATNYLGSTTWQAGQRTQYVQGEGYACSDQETITQATALPYASCYTLPSRPPLQLYECIPLPATASPLLFLAVGGPVLLLVLLLLHLSYRRSMPVVVGTPHAYGEWNYFFTRGTRLTNAELAIAATRLQEAGALKSSSSTGLLLVRHLQVQHSFFCLFFDYPADSFDWRFRAFCLVIEQAINFAVQGLFTIVLIETSASPSLTETIVSVCLSVVMASAVSLVLPVRRLTVYLRRRDGSSCSRFLAGFWVFVCVAGAAVFMYITIHETMFAQHGAQAPNPGTRLVVYTLLVYIAATPYHWLLEIFTCSARALLCSGGVAADLNLLTVRFSEHARTSSLLTTPPPLGAVVDSSTKQPVPPPAIQIATMPVHPRLPSQVQVQAHTHMQQPYQPHQQPQYYPPSPMAAYSPAIHMSPPSQGQLAYPPMQLQQQRHQVVSWPHHQQQHPQQQPTQWHGMAQPAAPQAYYYPPTY